MNSISSMLVITLIVSYGLISTCTSKLAENKTTTVIGIEKVKPVIIKKIPHDPTAFTQGLFYNNGKLYESTGINCKSTIRIVDTTGHIEILRSVPEVFAEGCALLNNILYQITWQEQVCITYAFPSLEITGTLNYEGEGWGLTSDSRVLYMSNGSDTITIRNVELEILHQFAVTLAGKPLKNINELEFVNGIIFANVWFSDFIFEIDIDDGTVIRIVDCSEIVALENPSSEQHILNGIAFVKQSGLLYVTGKNWKSMFLVKIPE